MLPPLDTTNKNIGIAFSLLIAFGLLYYFVSNLQEIYNSNYEYQVSDKRKKTDCGKSRRDTCNDECYYLKGNELIKNTKNSLECRYTNVGDKIVKLENSFYASINNNFIMSSNTKFEFFLIFLDLLVIGYIFYFKIRKEE